MKILHVLTYTSGGAGISCIRLHHQLTQAGVDSKVLAFETSLANGKDIFEYKKLNRGLTSRIHQSIQWRRQGQMLKGRSNEYDFFSLPYVSNSIHHTELVRSADIIHLHWVANFISYKEISLFKKKIIWTLHDMNPVTGGCHYSYSCKRFEEVCYDCPQLKGTINPNVVTNVFKSKKEYYSKSDLNFVAPSGWMLNNIRSGNISLKVKAQCIPYGLDLEVFKPSSKAEARKKLNLPLDKKIVLYVADNIENKRKGFYLLDKIIDSTFDNSNVLFCCIGSNSQNLNLKKIQHLGFVSDESQLATIYSAADLFIMPALEDNLPNTVLESIACGTPVIAFNCGGIPEIIDDGLNGFLIEKNNVDVFKKKIYETIHDDNLLEKLGKNARQKALDKFKGERQASDYLNLYKEVLNPTTTALK